MSDQEPLDERITKSLAELRSLLDDPKDLPRHNDQRLWLFHLRDLLIEKCNAPFTTCGTGHLAAERALRIIERHGYPGDERWEFLTMLTDQAGQEFNAARTNLPHDDDVPF